MAQAPRATTPWYALKQGAAGLAEATVADASLPGESYRPSLIYNLPAVADFARNIFSGAPEQSDFLSDSSKRVQAASERANNFFGVEEPQNALETAARYGLPLLIPGAGVASGIAKGVAKGAAKVAPKATKAVGDAGRAVATANPRTTAAAAKLAPVVAEILAPVNLTTKTKKGTAALAGGAGAFGAGVSEAVDYLQPNADYISIRETLLGIRDPEFVAEDGFTYTNLDTMDAQQMHMADSNDLNNAIAGTMIGLGAVLGVRSLRDGRVAAKIAQQEQEVAGVAMTGKQFETSDLLTAGEQVATKLADSNLPIRKAVETATNKQYATEIGMRASLLSNNAQASRSQHFMRTGEIILPSGVSRRYTPLGPVLEQAGQELDVDTMKVVSDAMISRSVMDTYARTGKLITNETVDGKQVTYADHLANVNRATSDPQLVEYMDAIDQSYREILHYKLETGLISTNEYQRLRAENPNYAQLSNDVEKLNAPRKREDFSANRIISTLARTEDEGGSIKAGAFASPLNTIADAWAQTIRATELNNFRSELLQTLSGAAGTSNIVKRVGKANKETDKVHTVFENGTRVDYIVNDPALSEALNFFPRSATILLDKAREFGQMTTTGPLGSVVSGSWFTALKSPMYDTLTVAGNRGKMSYGLINEGLEKITSGKLSLGSLDLSQYITAYSGAVRLLAEDMVGSAARSMADKLASNQSGILYGVPRPVFEQVQQTLEKSFEASVKAMMDRHGATSSSFFGSEDLARPMSGMEGIAPSFARLQSDYAMSEVVKGSKDPMRIGQEVARRTSTHVASNFMARATTKVFHALNNGAKYSLFAANKDKFTDPAMLAAMVRDASVDTAKHGSSQAVNRVTSSVMYSNLAIQTMYRMGQAFKNDPMAATMNYVGPAVSLAALYLASNAMDPDVLEANRNKTIEQKISSPTIFGGVEIPVEHVNRMIWGPMVAVIDELFGVNSGELDIPAIQQLMPLLDDMMSEEAFQKAMKKTGAYVVEGISPISIDAEAGKPTSFGNPLFDTFAASMGMDITQNRIAGRVTEPQEQAPITDLNNPDRNDARIGAQAANILAGLGGAAGQAMVQMYNDFAGAMGEGYNLEQATQVSGSRYMDRFATGAGLVKPLAIDAANHLFGPYEVKQSTVDTEWLILNDKVEGVQAQQKLYQLNNRGDLTSQGPTATLRATPVQPLEGNQLYIAAMADQLMKDKRMTFYSNRAKDLTTRARDIQHGYGVRIGDRNMSLNELNVERRRIARERLEIVNEYENYVREALGDPDFTWTQFKP